MLELVFDQFKAEVNNWKRQIEIQQEDAFTSTRNGKFIEITSHPCPLMGHIFSYKLP